MPTLDLLLRGALLAWLGLLALQLWRARAASGQARLAAALALGLAVQVLAQATPLRQALHAGGPGALVLQAGFTAVANGNAVLFWLLARALFDDDFQSQPAHALAWATLAGLGAGACVLGPGPGLGRAVLAAALNTAPVCLAGLAGWAAVARWSDDLVPRRRRLRAVLVWGGGGYALTVAALRQQSGAGLGPLPPQAQWLELLSLTGVVAVVASQWLRLARSELLGPLARPCPPVRAGELFDPAPAALLQPQPQPSAGLDPAAPDPEPADPSDLPWLHRLQQRMAQDHLYREEGLSLGRLAQHLGLPEYRLRRLIHQHLGHRHFSAYLHSLRLAEACAHLSDRTQAQRAVLDIALAVGFQSIGPFNRAFKAHTGLTPTEFRRQQLADS